MKFLALVISLFLLTACGPSVLRESGSGVPDWVASKFVVSKRSAEAPSFANNEIGFSITQSTCTNLRDVSGPSDCSRRTST